MNNFLQSLKKVSVLNWMLYIFLGIIGYMLLGSVSSILEFFNLKPDEAEKAQAELEKQQELDRQAAIDRGYNVPKGVNPSKDATAWQQNADTIYQKLDNTAFGTATYAQRYAVYLILYSVKTIADWNLLVKYFGVRQPHIFGFSNGDPKSLVPFLNSFLDQKGLNNVRAEYAKKGLKIAL